METYVRSTAAPFLSESYPAFIEEDDSVLIRIPDEQELSVRQIGHYVDKPKFRETGYNTTTFGKIGFTRVDAKQVTEDLLLQARLDILCDKLRARY